MVFSEKDIQKAKTLGVGKLLPELYNEELEVISLSSIGNYFQMIDKSKEFESSYSEIVYKRLNPNYKNRKLLLEKGISLNIKSLLISLLFPR